MQIKTCKVNEAENYEEWYMFQVQEEYEVPFAVYIKQPIETKTTIPMTTTGVREFLAVRW